MKKSIKHLPKRTQEELNAILELIKEHIPWCCMVILYGSYARGSYVLYDERVEFGVRTIFQSDLDIMIVCSKHNTEHIESRLGYKIEEEYEDMFAHRRHAPVQFIVEDIVALNKKLNKKQYFYADVVKEGILIYDNREFELTKSQKLSYSDVKCMAMTEFNMHYPSGNVFLKNGHFSFKEKDYKEGSFLLHQACERYYKAISLVHTLYSPKQHSLRKLRNWVKGTSRELDLLFPIFPINHEPNNFEERCYDLLCRAYVEARYNRYFKVTKEEYQQMLKWVEALKEITEKVCKERIEYYDSLIAQG